MDKLKELQEGAMTQYSKFANKKLMIGTMSGLAMVTNANGVVKDEEMQTMIAAISTDPDLQCYDITEMIGVFTEKMEQFKINKFVGDAACLAEAGKIKDVAQGRMLIGKCCAIAASDGDFDNNEKDVVRKLCNAVKVSPGEFDL